MQRLASQTVLAAEAPLETPTGALGGGAAPRWVHESVGVVVALALAVLAVWHMDAGDRSWMLYYDSDSVLPALVRGSVLSGQPQDWALSAVLFIPEMGLYLAIAALGLGIKATFAINAVVNFLLFYGCLRLLSGFAQRGLPRPRRIAGALIAFGAMMAFTLLDDSSRPDTFELASLLATTTYYSMTLLASVTATGMVTRLVTAPTAGRRRWLEWSRLELALLGLSAFSALTNPLYLVWAAVPLAIVLALVAWRRVLGWNQLFRVGGILALGGSLGLLARIPFTHLFAVYGPVYAEPWLAGVSAIYYPAKLADRTSTVGGALSIAAIIVLICVAVIVFRKSLAARDAAAAVVAGMGWVAPVALIVGAICVGTFATRYLQPLVYAPVCMLVLVPRLFPKGRAFVAGFPGRRPSRRTVQLLLAGAAVVSLGVSGLAAGALSRSAAAVDSDVLCVDAWISASHRTGAGSFWTIRGPKAYLADPGRLIQVDRSFGSYQWLTDRADNSTARVSFVLTDDAHPAPALPAAATTAPSSTVRCGRYTITDFGADVLPIGPASPHPLA